MHLVVWWFFYLPVISEEDLPSKAPLRVIPNTDSVDRVMAQRGPHSLSLKVSDVHNETHKQVMRLRKPTLVHQILPTITASPFTSSPLKDLSDSTLIDASLDGNGVTGLAVLPNGFGNMYVGTTFQAYVCLNYENEEEVTEVSITAEIRTKTNSTTLNPTITRLGTNEPTIETTFKLPPGEAIHQILEHSLAPS